LVVSGQLLEVLLQTGVGVFLAGLSVLEVLLGVLVISEDVLVVLVLLEQTRFFGLQLFDEGVLPPSVLSGLFKPLGLLTLFEIQFDFELFVLSSHLLSCLCE
jgi:hypothetical protein